MCVCVRARAYVCVSLSLYIYVCVCVCVCVCVKFRIYLDLDFLVFIPNNSLATKLKKLDGHATQNWTSIGFGLFDIYTQ